MYKTSTATFKRFISLGIICLPLYAVFAQDDVTGDVGAVNEAKLSRVQNAVLEGIQLSAEKGTVADETLITCYFIFRDQPSSYFFDSKLKEKKIVFEFNDTELGITPISSTQETPIENFRIEQTKINTNEAVQGLTPEWHDLLRVIFTVSDMPRITVKDEYSIISFTYKWSNDPAKKTEFVVRKKKPIPLIVASIGVGLAAGAGAAYYVMTKPVPPDTTPKPIPINDLPTHPTP
jgi:hypothetical protein